MTVYFETEESLRNFRIDDIRIYGIPKNISDSAEDENMKYNFGFESSLDGWISRGDISIVPTSEFSYTGKYSLYVSGRKDFWNAPMIVPTVTKSVIFSAGPLHAEILSLVTTDIFPL